MTISKSLIKPADVCEFFFKVDLDIIVSSDSGFQNWFLIPYPFTCLFSYWYLREWKVPIVFGYGLEGMELSNGLTGTSLDLYKIILKM